MTGFHWETGPRHTLPSVRGCAGSAGDAVLAISQANAWDSVVVTEPHDYETGRYVVSGVQKDGSRTYLGGFQYGGDLRATTRFAS